ncbi:MAG: hypothetical protein PHY79_14110 [Anaerolineae bacterium]|nr:hypothetical protein [Anaerolineae bacterium]
MDSDTTAVDELKPPTCNCTHCPAFRRECEGCTQPCSYSECNSDCTACPVRCNRRADLDEWLASIGGLALDVPLQPQPQFRLAGYFPQLLNGLEVPSALFSAGDLAVGIAKVLTPRGRVSRRALPWEFGPYSLRTQWQVSEINRLVCIGNDQDDHLERLWKAQLAAGSRAEDIWMQMRVLGFDFATSLNFSIYLDQPRMEHLINVKRSWLTVAQIQQIGSLLPIPHLQWATILDLQRQLHYTQEQGFHTLTMNLQMLKRQGWDAVSPGFPLIRAQAPGLRFLFAGVVSLKRMQALASMFPESSFTNTTAHYLAQRRVRLQSDGTRLIKEPVDGHPDLILAENARRYRDFLDATNGKKPQPQAPPSPSSLQVALHEVVGALQEQFGFESQAAYDAFDRLAADEAILQAFLTWLRTGELEPDFGGKFATWPCAGCVSHPTLGQLLSEGADPIDAFLHLAHLAHQVDEEIQVFVGQAGY